MNLLSNSYTSYILHLNTFHVEIYYSFNIEPTRKGDKQFL